MGPRHASRSAHAAEAASQLTKFFRRNGYVRRQNPDRIAAEGWGKYKKGDEVRLAAGSTQELAQIRRLLKIAGFKPGRPFAKSSQQYRQPIYGRDAVARFLEMIEKVEADQHEDAANVAARRR